MQRFTIAWNVLAGIPMLTPSFFYSNHIDHHATKHYGTGQVIQCNRTLARSG